MTQASACLLWMPLYLYSWGFTNMPTRRHMWSECYETANFRDIYPPACELLCLCLMDLCFSFINFQSYEYSLQLEFPQIAANYSQIKYLTKSLNYILFELIEIVWLLLNWFILKNSHIQSMNWRIYIHVELVPLAKYEWETANFQDNTNFKTFGLL